VGQPLALRAGGARWWLAPGCGGPGGAAEALFGPQGLRLAEWRADGRATLLKHGPHRSVYRVVLSGLDFHVKHDHPANARGRLRALVRPGKARREYVRMLAVARRGIPTPVPLAAGESGAGGGPRSSYLLTYTLPDVRPLHGFLESTLPGLAPGRRTRVRQRIAAALGGLLARMHAAGVTHRDLHPGNLLVRLDGSDEPRLWLIDLDAVRLGRPLSWRARRANLVVLNRYFVLRATRADRRRFWRAYHAVWQGTGAPQRDTARRRSRDLERGTRESNLHFWRRLDRSCLAANRHFRRVRAGAVTGHAVSDLPAEALAALLADPDEPFRRPGVRVLKASPSSRVVEFDLPGPDGPRRVIYKRIAVTAWSDPWAALLRPTAALRSWVLGHGLRLRGLPTPRPLGVWHRRGWGLPREGYLLTEKVDGAVDLAARAAQLAEMPAAERRPAVRGLARELARLVRALHQRRLSHRDLKAANILVQAGQGRGEGGGAAAFPYSISRAPVPAGALWLIDLAGVRRHGKLERSRRARDLARLHASFLCHPAVSRTDKLRFLRDYLGWGLHGRGEWKEWWGEVEAATRAKVERNRRSGRPLA
jgi:tRNA A-37 threonylcarbamoyl transferase component Bud32